MAEREPLLSSLAFEAWKDSRRREHLCYCVTCYAAHLQVVATIEKTVPRG